MADGIDTNQRCTHEFISMAGDGDSVPLWTPRNGRACISELYHQRMETRELPVEPHSSKLNNHALGMKSSTLLDCTWTRATNLPQLQRDLRDSRERHLGLCSPLCSLRGSGEVCGTVHQRHVGTRWSKGGGASHTVLLKTILFLQRQEWRLKEVRKAELGSHSHFLNVKKQQCLHRFLDVFL